MESALAYYIEADIVCFIIFGIMLMFDLANVDRQKKQVMFDYVLISFMLYLVADALRVEVAYGALPANTFSVTAAVFLNYIMGIGITYTWLRFVLASVKARFGNRRKDKFLLLLPFGIATTALVATYCVAPHLLLDGNLQVQPLAYAFNAAVHLMYLLAIIVYALVHAHKEKDPLKRRETLFIGFFPLIVVLGAALDMLMPTLPVFCFSFTILMLVFYIQAMQSRISIDPLTGLNNRGQLVRYISQHSNLRQKDRLTYVVIVDANDFKAVNDTYGHAEGDKALIIIASALKHAAGNCGYPVFLSRYGGDEFLLIAHPSNEKEIKALTRDIRTRIGTECKSQKTHYLLTVGIGYNLLADENDTFQKCLTRADRRLYQDKKLRKVLPSS